MNKASSVDPLSRSTGWQTFNVGVTVQSRIDGSAPNYGFCFRADEGAYTYTKRQATATGVNAPTLTLTYEVLQATGGMMIQIR